MTRRSACPQFIWGGMPRIGDINPEQEPYRDVLAQEQITVFDLTKLEGNNAHTRAFDDITQVVVMVREQLNEEPVGERQGRRIAGARTNDRSGSRAALTTAD